MNNQISLINCNEVIEPRIHFEDIPLNALRQRSREKLSLLLNPKKVLPTEDGHHRDWRGVFTMSGLGQPEYNMVSESNDKMAKILDLWNRKNLEKKRNISLIQLQNAFGIIDRYDVYDDTYQLFSEDAQAFLSKSRSTNKNSSACEIVQGEPENNIITEQDVINAEKGLPLQVYDAFVIYDDKDIEFTTDLVERLETLGYSLCLKDRILGGFSIESEAILELLSNRCNRLIVIVSKAFLKSPMQLFITNCAQAFGIEHGKRKIIPCLLEPCDLPQMLRYCFRLDYFRNNKLFDFWDKLDKSLKATVDLRRSIEPESAKLQDIEHSTNDLKLSESSDPLYDRSGYKFTETPTPTPTPSDKHSRKNFFFRKASPEPKAQIMPPLPKMREASSMMSLDSPDDSASLSTMNKLSQSTFFLNQNGSQDLIMASVKTKRKKWYNIFLPPSSKKDLKSVKESYNEDSYEPKMKKEKNHWYKKTKKINKQKSEIAITC